TEATGTSSRLTVAATSPTPITAAARRDRGRAPAAVPAWQRLLVHRHRLCRARADRRGAHRAPARRRARRQDLPAAAPDGNELRLRHAGRRAARPSRSRSRRSSFVTQQADSGVGYTAEQDAVAARRRASMTGAVAAGVL